MIKKETRLFELFSCSPPLPPPLLAADAGGVWVSEYLGVSERLLSSCRLWQCLSFWKAHFPCLSCLQFKPFDVFPRAEPNALDPLPSMLMFSDWLMNLLINPLVCAPQHCPLWNGIRRGERRNPLPTEWHAVSGDFKVSGGLCWSDRRFKIVCNLFLWEILSPDRKV